ELPSTVGAVALSFALASARNGDRVAKPIALRAGRVMVLLMPVVAALVLSASFWQFHEANTTRLRIDDVHARGSHSPYACDLHPYSALSADIRLAHGLVTSHRPVFKRAAEGERIGIQDVWLIDAYVCSANARVLHSTSPSLLLVMESFRGAIAHGETASDLPGRYRASLDNWAENLVRVLTLVPYRPEIANGFFLAQIQRGNLHTVGSLAQALLKRNPNDPVALWFLGLARIGTGDPALQEQGKRLLERALNTGVQRLLPLESDLVEQVRAYQPGKR
ncbi:unnamed protein product, partial [Laminaria digitata]